MSRPKAFVPMELSEGSIQRLSEVCAVTRWTQDGRCPADVMEKEIADADALVGYYPCTGKLMDGAPRLRVIATPSVGFDHVDVAAATARGIVVTNTPDVLTDTTADLAFSLLMAAARRIAECDRFIRAGGWTEPAVPGRLFGMDLHHATIGIVGMGRIGAAMAQRALGFRMKVLYHDFVRREDLERQHGYHFVDLDTLLAESDFVSIHVPLLPETRGMIGTAQLARMKSTACLINAARGPIVDERALVAALREGRIAGAGLDVFEKEPVALDNPLLKLENVVMAPHVGSATRATRNAMAMLAVDNAIAVLQAKTPPTPVNPEVLGKLTK